MADQESFLAKETEQFRALYIWLRNSFPTHFLDELGEESLLLIAHSLVGFKLQSYYSAINFATSSIVLSRDAQNSDYRIYEQYEGRLIRSMHTFVSQNPLPGETHYVRISFLLFGTEEVLLPEHAKSLIEKARSSDFTQCEITSSKDREGVLELKMSTKEAPQKAYVGRLFKALLMRDLAIGRLYFVFVQPDILYFEADLHGKQKALLWEELDVQELVQELALVRDFAMEDQFDETFIRQVYGSGQIVIFLRSVSCFVQKLLYHLDPHMYSLENVQEAFCYWPELTKNLYTLFCKKCDPHEKNLEDYAPLRLKLLELIDKQDTGKEKSDLRRKTALRYGMHFVDSILKTNFFTVKKGAISYRLDSSFLQELYDIFPKAPFGVFYIYSRDFFGFHIRFQDLARGGMRTIVMRSLEAALEEAPYTFFECYQLALTQEKKNKDIPEGGAKAICLLYPEGNLYRAQRLFIKSLLQLVAEKESDIVDYYGLPEYLYLGPDENMHDSMIEWIAAYATSIDYFPKSAFITSKPKVGINHKRYGVTSFGVNVCMQEVLRYLGIEPNLNIFTVKMAGGPDGDVAGNQILNLGKYFSKTAKLIALVDISGLIYEPNGLDFEILRELFLQAKPIRHYPLDRLTDGAFLLDMRSEKKEAAHIVKILCTKKVGDILKEEWLSGSEALSLYRTFVHKIPADVFIPAGGRPATLSQFNVAEFLDSSLRPTAKAIIEGANLYLTQEARDFLEQKGAIIIKDSSANKGGVICSSFEVLSGLALSDELFLEHKEEIVKEILQKIEQYAQEEVKLILQTHARSEESCSRISEKISETINRYREEIRDYLLPMNLEQSSFLSCFFEYSLPILVDKFSDKLMANIPDMHKKAIIAAWIASKVVYSRGLEWSPSIVDILPFLILDPKITACPIKRV